MDEYYDCFRDGISLKGIFSLRNNVSTSYIKYYIESRGYDTSTLHDMSDETLLETYFRPLHEHYDAIEVVLNNHLKEFYRTDNINCYLMTIYKDSISYVIEVRFRSKKALNLHKLKSPERHEFLTDKSYHGEKIYCLDKENKIIMY